MTSTPNSFASLLARRCVSSHLKHDGRGRRKYLFHLCAPEPVDLPPQAPRSQWMLRSAAGDEEESTRRREEHFGGNRIVAPAETTTGRLELKWSEAAAPEVGV